MPSVLVATPTYSKKAYSLRRWINAVNRITVLHETLLVDTSDTEEFYDEWNAQVRMMHLDTANEPPNRKIALGMEYIRLYALSKNIEWWFSLESDVIPQAGTLEYMLSQAEGFDFVTVPYKSRTQPGVILERSFGCTLFSKHMLERFTFSGAPADITTDAHVWGLGTWKWRCLRTALCVEHLSN